MTSRLPRAAELLDLLLLEAAKLPRELRSLLRRPSYDEFYDEFFSDKDQLAYDADPRMVLRRATVREALERRLPPGAAVLDVGCGLGDVLASLGDRFERFGVDYSERNVAYVRQRLGAEVDVRQSAIETLPFDAGSMDGCICLEVLEHIEDDEAAVIELGRVVREGGWLVASVPSTYYFRRYQKLIGHFRHYDRQSFAALLQHGGFDVREHLPTHPGWHRAYGRRYVAVRAASMILSRLSPRFSPSPYDFVWPTRQQPALREAARALEPLLRAEASLDYATSPTSTFVAARRSR
ncbi:MAG: methyltransferase domain-containing protein [Deltaproteobacteria bacterium]|jgi:SAM-dependent methyltransferase|nr:methyltransferase domain-containing protein [Deltaproteobacteria bacterium]